MEEALNPQFLQQFYKWCISGDKALPPGLSELFSRIETAFPEDNDVHQIKEQLSEVLSNDLLPLITAFRSEGQATSPTFQLWGDLLFKLLHPLKVFIKATRDGLWHAQQSAKAEFLPLLFASNRTN